ncbi:MAG TPA: hypothetical protein VMN78_07420 [Longimicrobiales bacterium]|nr:hypothetical protein [Longimicrobiales bacterium]
MRPRLSRECEGCTLAEATVALLLAGLLTSCLACILLVTGRLAARHSRVSTESETERVVAAVLGGELRTLTAVDALFDPDSVRLRAFRGVGRVCAATAGTVIMRYRGVRAPEPDKDSVLLLWPDGEAAFDLEAAAVPAFCPGGEGAALAVGVPWRTAEETAPPAIALVFETGAYSLAGGAFRYRRGAGGRQPLTDATLSDTGSTLVEVAHEGSLSSAAVIRLLPDESPGAQPLSWRLLMPQRGARPGSPRSRRRFPPAPAPPPRAARTDGFALVTIVLLMIGLAVLATGLVFAASQHATLLASTHDVLRARYAAEASLTVVMRDWIAAERSLDTIGSPVVLLAATDLEPGISMAAQSERVGRDLFLIGGTGSVSRPEAPPIRQGAARLVRSIDTHGVGLELNAAVIGSHVRVSGDGAVRGDAAVAAPVDSSAAALCAGWPPDGAAIRAPPDSVFIASGAMASGDPPHAPDADPSRFLAGIGFLSTDALAGEALRIDEAIVTPTAATVGEECATRTPGNFGAPAGPCAAHWPLLHAPASLTLDGGYAQGILIVDGDLVLDGGVHVRGLVLVRGALLLRDATVAGALLAARVHVDRGSASLDRCAVATALTVAPALRMPRPPLRSWLPVFD